MGLKDYIRSWKKIGKEYKEFKKNSKWYCISLFTKFYSSEPVLVLGTSPMDAFQSMHESAFMFKHAKKLRAPFDGLFDSLPEGSSQARVSIMEVESHGLHATPDDFIGETCYYLNIKKNIIEDENGKRQRKCTITVINK